MAIEWTIKYECIQANIIITNPADEANVYIPFVFLE